MANPQHIKWLLEGVDKWNARREREVFVPDFEGADMAQSSRRNTSGSLNLQVNRPCIALSCEVYAAICKARFALSRTPEHCRILGAQSSLLSIHVPVQPPRKNQPCGNKPMT